MKIESNENLFTIALGVVGTIILLPILVLMNTIALVNYFKRGKQYE